MKKFNEMTTGQTVGVALYVGFIMAGVGVIGAFLWSKHENRKLDKELDEINAKTDEAIQKAKDSLTDITKDFPSVQ